ncbi:MAG: DUF456 domain-containing protein [Patescibacteria group bacterium]|nr:DUF456 domain-containing protein [Patescibacteria group bacterium]
MTIVYAVLFVLFLTVCWLLNLFGLPGNWLVLAAVVVYVWLVPADSAIAIGWKTVIALLVLAILGEIIEFLAGAAGVSKAGGSRRGAVLAILGSIVGGLVGAVVGVPIPLVGSIIAAVLFAAIGAMAGAAVGELWVGRDAQATWHIARLAFWGRLAGTVGKVIIGAAMIAVAIGGVLVS